MCTDIKTPWQISMWFAIDLEVKVGARLAIEKLVQAIEGLFSKGDTNSGDLRLDRAATVYMGNIVQPTLITLIPLPDALRTVMKRFCCGGDKSVYSKLRIDTSVPKGKREYTWDDSPIAQVQSPPYTPNAFETARKGRERDPIVQIKPKHESVPRTGGRRIPPPLHLESGVNPRDRQQMVHVSSHTEDDADDEYYAYDVRKRYRRFRY